MRAGSMSATGWHLVDPANLVPGLPDILKSITQHFESLKWRDPVEIPVSDSSIISKPRSIYFCLHEVVAPIYAERDTNVRRSINVLRGKNDIALLQVIAFITAAVLVSICEQDVT